MLGGVLLSNLVSQRLPKVSTPLVQVVIGVALAMLPISFEISLDPELFLVLFIAPLLFEDAKKADKPALWRLKRPILLLALGLVVATTLVVGFSVHWFAPSIPLAAAFALAAALAPTDAVTVGSLKETSTISVGQRLLLQGEALLNDASSIVSFQFAIAAAITGAFSLFDAGTTFLFMFLGGLILGVALMLLRMVTVRMFRNAGVDSITFHVLFEVITPLLVFLIAEAIHVSGIIAVVAAGIVHSISPRLTNPGNARHSVVSTSVWSVISYTLNGLVFLILGTQLPFIAQRVWTDSSVEGGWLILFIVLILIAILLLRFLWVLAMNRNVNLAAGAVDLVEDVQFEGEGQADAAPATEAANSAADSEETRLAREFGVMDEEERELVLSRHIDAERQQREEQRQALRLSRRQRIKAQILTARSDPNYWKLHLHDAVLLSLTGAKGAITLAVALTIPLTMADGSPFPERDLLLFLASGVILLSLLVANFLVPLIAPKKAEPIRPESELNAILDIYRTVVRRLVEQMEPEEKPATDEVIRGYYDRINNLKQSNNFINSQETMVREKILEWEREHTLELIDQGRVSSLTGLIYINQLSRVWARIKHHNAVRWEFMGIIEQFRHRINEARRVKCEIKEARKEAEAAVSKREQGQGARPSGSKNRRQNRRAVRFELRELMLENYRNVIEKLRVYQEEEGAPKRIVGLVKMEFERRAARFESPRGFAPGAQSDHHLFLRVEARALEFEREAINLAREQELISRDTAKQLRDSVAVMELDIEEQLE